jgi:hypothetical protein
MTRDCPINRLLVTCSPDQLADTREVAVLLLASGGRRLTNGAAALRSSQRPSDPTSPALSCLPAWAPKVLVAVGEGASCGGVGPNGWSGPKLPGIRFSGPSTPGKRWKRRLYRCSRSSSCELSVRAGWIGCDGVCRTKSEIGALAAARRGVPFLEMFRQRQHRSVQQAASYKNDADRGRTQACRLTL